MPDVPVISIIVACRNEKNFIHTLLDSIAEQDIGEKWEAIIADGLSDDGTREILTAYAEQDPRFRIVPNPGRFVSYGLNAAIREARGEIIVRMDAHTRYAADYLRRSVAILREAGAENVGGPARTFADSYLGRAIAAAYHSRFSCGGARFHDASYEGPVDTVPYGCWRKETLLRLGLFDEQLVRNQDDELNLRIRRSGGIVWQSPAIRSWYRPRADLYSLFRQYLQYGFWKVAVIRKHRLPASWRHIIPGAFVLWHVLLLVVLLAAMVFSQESLAVIAAALFAGSAGTYLVACVCAALSTGWRDGWELAPVMPVVFAAYHFSYGLGFLAGLVLRPGRASNNSDPGLWFTRLSH